MLAADTVMRKHMESPGVGAERHPGPVFIDPWTRMMAESQNRCGERKKEKAMNEEEGKRRNLQPE